MIFTLLTFLAALTTAGVAEWFSIVGIISIYAGAPYNAGLILGIVLGFAKLVNTSWLYRNWETASWKIKGPLVYFLLALMLTTSMGVFGFLTKSHLEQGASTVDNSAKIERLDQQITREKGTIADDEKIITQLDAAINSYIGKDKTDKAVAIRKSQSPQRKQLRDDIDASQKKIDGYSEDKLKLTSEVRALQLEIGPIRYIAELFYGTDGDQSAKIESAVKMFTLLIVSTLDPLAIILLIAANHTLMRRQDEKEEKNTQTQIIHEAAISPIYESSKAEEESYSPPKSEQTVESNEQVVRVNPDEESYPTVDAESITSSAGNIGSIDEKEEINSISTEGISGVLADNQCADEQEQEAIAPIRHIHATRAEMEQVAPQVLHLNEEEEAPKSFYWPAAVQAAPAIVRSPSITKVARPITDSTASAITATALAPISSPAQLPVEQNAVLREILGSRPHFIPQKINEETKYNRLEEPAALVFNDAPTEGTSISAIAKAVQEVEEGRSGQVQESNEESAAVQDSTNFPALSDKYPVRLSWLKEFKGN